jgi:hypothetical protein
MASLPTSRNRGCTAMTADGRRCGSPALRSESFCFLHHPDHASEAADARRLGGLRRRKEATIAFAYDLGDPGTLDYPRRLLEITATDSLALDNSVGRNHTLVMVAKAYARVTEIGWLETRIAALEDALSLERRRERPYLRDSGEGKE